MGRIHHTVRDVGAAEPLDRGGESNSRAAMTVLSNLSADRHSDYRALVTALENRFGTAHQAQLQRMKLRNRTRRREESLAELMEDIERLARLAYPDAAPAMLELIRN